jgi:hypothetical protein
MEVSAALQRGGGQIMQIFAELIELKPGSSKRVEEWAEHVRANREQAEETLRAEGVAVESWFALSIEGKDYLLSYMRVESMEEAQRVVGESQHPIDAYHQQFKIDTWVRGGGAVGALLVDLTGASR